MSGWLGQAMAIVIGGVVLGVPVAAWRWGNKHVATPLKQVPIIAARVETVDKKVDTLGLRLGPIEEQFNVNHGSSLRDSNDRSEKLNRAMADKMGLDPQAIAPSGESV